jgi:hypothetical protein
MAWLDQLQFVIDFMKIGISPLECLLGFMGFKVGTNEGKACKTNVKANPDTAYTGYIYIYINIHQTFEWLDMLRYLNTKTSPSFLSCFVSDIALFCHIRPFKRDPKEISMIYIHPQSEAKPA